MNYDNFVYILAVNAIPFLFAITLHEAAHGYAARVFGDRTAEMMGRITLNPIKHIDWIGTVAIPSLTLMFGGFFFGWAKPVPVNSNNLRNPKTDMIWVAAAGPAANLVMAIGWAIVYKLAEGNAIDAIARAGIAWNVGLMVLNLLPLLPLDGGRIIAGLLPGPLSYKFSRTEQYGFFILMGLIVLELNGVRNVFSYVIQPLSRFFRQLLGL
jgi:Zn-dependent protease